MKDYWDYYSTMKTSTDKAEKKKAIEIDRKMKAKGFSFKDIADVTVL